MSAPPSAKSTIPLSKRPSMPAARRSARLADALPSQRTVVGVLPCGNGKSAPPAFRLCHASPGPNARYGTAAARHGARRSDAQSVFRSRSTSNVPSASEARSTPRSMCSKATAMPSHEVGHTAALPPNARPPRSSAWYAGGSSTR